MKCPYCGSENNGIKESKQSGAIRRRRYACLDCGQRFTTHEIPVRRVYKNHVPLTYVSTDGSWVAMEGKNDSTQNTNQQ